MTELVPAQIPVTVSVRVRPLTTGEVNDKCHVCVTCTSRDQLQLSGDKVFRFDRVFPSASSQAEVYEEIVQPLVNRCLQGINCTVFAYGQTGSGKTYTLGSEGMSLRNGGPNEGMIPRALAEIFTSVREREAAGEMSRCQLSVSYIEVYKEEMRDLLADDDTAAISIREDENGRTVLVGVVDEEVSSVEEALNLLECGNAVRITSATEMNTYSSRSHVAFILTIVQEKKISLPVLSHVDMDGNSFFTKLVSKFHFVDLAGSERVKRTRNTGERFKESVHINGGLLALGNVITALADSKRKSSHIPYRDSKITRLLKDSLGGHSQTVMITCLSPADRDLPESLNTLKYAKRARNIKNHPIVNQDPQTMSVLAMKDEIESLRTKLQLTREGVGGDNSVIDFNERVHCLKSELESVQVKYQSMHSVLIGISERLADTISQQSVNPETLPSLLQEIWRLISTVRDGETRDVSSDFICTSVDTDSLVRVMDTVEALRKEIEKCKSDLLADEEIFAEKEAEQANLQHECELLAEKNDQLETKVRDMKEREEQLLNEMKQLEDRLRDQPAVEVLTKTDRAPPSLEDATNICAAELQTLSSQSHDSLWIDRSFQSIHHKIDLRFLKEPSHKSCDLALRQMTSLLATCKQLRTSHDNNVTRDNDVMEQSHDIHSLSHDEATELSQNIILSQERLQSMEKRVMQEQHKIRSLNLKIKLKEELIHELIKSNKAVKCLNSAYQKKITALEKEAVSLKQKITEVTSCRSKTSGSESDAGKREDTMKELRKKLKETEVKLSSLQHRRQETLRLLQSGEKSDQRIAELEGELERLRNRQSSLKRKAKEEGERKKRLEREIEQCRRKVTKLTEQTEQQGHILRVKTEEVAIAQRKLRDIKRPMTVKQPSLMNSRQFKWLQEEIQKLAFEKEALNRFQKDLKERELIVSQHESLLKEKTSLQAKKAQVHQSSAQNVLHLSMQLNVLADLIRKKETLRDSLEECSVDDLKIEIEKLTDKHKLVTERKQAIEEQLSNEKILTPEEETRILELQDQIEVLEASLQLHTTSLYQRALPQSQGLIGLQSKVKQLTQSETQSLLVQSVLRIIELEEALSVRDREHEMLDNEVHKEREAVDLLKQSLSQLQLDKQQKLDKSKKEHAQEMQLLLNQMADTIESSEPAAATEEITFLKSKVKSLERDLYFYKKTSRDLKQQIKQVTKDT